jgi:hypothetical protein
MFFVPAIAGAGPSLEETQELEHVLEKVELEEHDSL